MLVRIVSLERLEHRIALNADGIVDNIGVVRGLKDDRPQWLLDLGDGSRPEIVLRPRISATNPILPVAGDWQNQDRDQPAAVDAVDGDLELQLPDEILLTNAPPSFPRPFGREMEFVVVGDWNGNGQDNVGSVRRVDDGLEWRLYVGQEQQRAPFVTKTEPSAKPVVGDWNGDGTTDIGFVEITPERVRRWSLIAPEQRMIQFEWGHQTDEWVVGNWDGIGGDNVGIVRRTRDDSQLEWLLDTDFAAGAELTRVFGVPGDLPVAGNWQYPAASFEWLSPQFNGVNPTVIDFGRIARGVTEFVTFRITNTGNLDLVVGRAEAPLGTEIVPIQGNRRIAPGDTTDFEIAFRPDSETDLPETVVLKTTAGDFDFSFRGTVFNATAARFIATDVQGRRLEQDSRVSFGTAAIDATASLEASFSLSNGGQTPFEIRNLSVSEGFRHQGPSRFRLNGESSQTITMSMDVDGAGPKRGTVTFEHNADGTWVEVSFELHGLVGNALFLAFDGYHVTNEQLKRWKDADWTRVPPQLSKLIEDGKPVSVEKFKKRELIDEIVRMVQNDLGPFNFIVETLGSEETIFEGFGVTTIFVGESDIRMHVSADLDDGNDNGTDIAFVQEENWLNNPEWTVRDMANVILHEAGHTFGLRHVSEHEQSGRQEVMGSGARQLLDAVFLDVDLPILGEPGKTQNSLGKMIELFGDSTNEFVFEDPLARRLPDIDGDGCVDFTDFLGLSRNFNRRGMYLDGDFDSNGVVDFTDFLQLSIYFDEKVDLFSLD